MMANKKSQTPRKTQTTRKGKAPAQGTPPNDEPMVEPILVMESPVEEPILVMESPMLSLAVPIEPLEEDVITQPPSPCASYSSSELSSDCEDMVVVAPAAESVRGASPSDEGAGLKSIACLCGGTYNLKTKSKHNKNKRHLSWCALTA